MREKGERKGDRQRLIDCDRTEERHKNSEKGNTLERKITSLTEDRRYTQNLRRRQTLGQTAKTDLDVAGEPTGVGTAGLNSLAYKRFEKQLTQVSFPSNIETLFN